MTNNIELYDEYKELNTANPYETARRVVDRCKALQNTKTLFVLELGGHIKFIRRHRIWEILSETEKELMAEINVHSESHADHLVMFNDLWQKVSRRAKFPFADFLSIGWSKLEVVKQELLATTTAEQALEVLHKAKTLSKRELQDEKTGRVRVWGKVYISIVDGKPTLKIKEAKSNTAGWWEVLDGKNVKFSMQYRAE